MVCSTQPLLYSSLKKGAKVSPYNLLAVYDEKHIDLFKQNLGKFFLLFEEFIGQSTCFNRAIESKTLQDHLKAIQEEIPKRLG